MTDLQSNNQFEQLMALKEITKLTGGLHEAQIMQLKLWGLGLFNHVAQKDLRIKYSSDTKTINFTIDTPKKPPQDMHIRITLLKAWVKSLLGDDWKVLVKDVRNNRTVRKGAAPKKGRKTPKP